MNKVFIPALACVIVLAGCTKQEPVVINCEEGDYISKLSSIIVYGSDSLVINQNYKNFSYFIDKEHSTETIEDGCHQWEFSIKRKVLSTPDYIRVIVPGPDRKERLKDESPSFPPQLFILDSRHFYYWNSLSADHNLKYGLLSTETLFPEIEIQIDKFIPQCYDTASLPTFIKKAETIIIKGDSVTFNYNGNQTEILNIIPYSDYEFAHKENQYGWRFSATNQKYTYLIEIKTVMSMSKDELSVDPCNHIECTILRNNYYHMGRYEIWNDDPLVKYEIHKPIKGCENLKPHLCRVYPGYITCKNATKMTYHNWGCGLDKEWGKGLKEFPDEQFIENYLIQNVPEFSQGDFIFTEDFGCLVHSAPPNQNGNCAITFIHWYPAESKGKKWKIYTIGINAIASNKFSAYMYNTSTGITPDKVEDDLNNYCNLGSVYMHNDGIDIYYFINNETHQDKYLWNGKEMIKSEDD